MTDLILREIIYHLTRLRSSSDSYIPSRTEEFAPVQFKTLFATVPVMARAQSESRPVTHPNDSAMPLEDLDEYGSESGSSPTTWKILIPMQQFRIPKTTALVRKKSTGNLI
jgi:hypothetical protein